MTAVSTALEDTFDKGQGNVGAHGGSAQTLGVASVPFSVSVRDQLQQWDNWSPILKFDVPEDTKIRCFTFCLQGYLPIRFCLNFVEIFHLTVDEGPLSLGKSPFISDKLHFHERLHEYFIRLKNRMNIFLNLIYST